MRNRLTTAALLLFLAGQACSQRTASLSRTPTPQSTVASPTPSPSPSDSPEPIPSPTAVGSPPGLLVTGANGAELFNAPGGRSAHRLPSAVTLPFDSRRGDWARVLTPCQNQLWLKTTDAAGVSNPEVVIDPGHGGDELGAQGSSGLKEKDVNLEVANRSAKQLAEQGVSVALTRTKDFRATLDFRSEFATAVRPEALVSVHHNSVPDGPRDRPGTETYYQFGSATSKRLAGLVYEEVLSAIKGFQAQWVGDTDAGAKWRLNSAGRDYYAILRRPRAGGVTATLAELSFISNPNEEALLARSEFIDAEAAGVARAIIRFLRTKDLGSGFTSPYPRTEPAGPGGGREGCVDPT